MQNNINMAAKLWMCATLACRNSDEKDFTEICIVLEDILLEIQKGVNFFPYSVFTKESAIEHVNKKFSDNCDKIKEVKSTIEEIKDNPYAFLIDQVGDHGKDDEEKDDEEKEPPRLRLGGVDADTVKCEGLLHSIALVGKRLYSIDVVRRGPLNIEATMYTDLNPTFRMFGTNFRKLSRAAFAAANGYIYQRRHEYERRKRAQEKKKENQDGE